MDILAEFNQWRAEQEQLHSRPVHLIECPYCLGFGVTNYRHHTETCDYCNGAGRVDYWGLTEAGKAKVFSMRHETDRLNKHVMAFKRIRYAS